MSNIGFICSIIKYPTITLKYTNKVSLISNFNGLFSLSINLISINFEIKSDSNLILPSGIQGHITYTDNNDNTDTNKDDNKDTNKDNNKDTNKDNNIDISNV